MHVWDRFCGTSWKQLSKLYYFVKDELARGRVDICYNGSYESVCGDTRKEEEASVTCEQLGFSEYGEG